MTRPLIALLLTIAWALSPDSLHAQNTPDTEPAEASTVEASERDSDRSPAQPAAVPPTRASPNLVVERNIFVRLRPEAHRPPTTDRPAAPPSPPPPLETQYVLLGIIDDEVIFRALIEDRRQNDILLVRLGDEVARGRITEIDLDSVVYEADGIETRVPIGLNLRGDAASPAAASTPRPTDDGGNDAATPANGDSMTPAERMRLRRMQELNRP
jgi:hypothetical protein